MRASFKTNLISNGKTLRVSLPESFREKRFEAYYSNGQVLIAESQDAKAIKATYAGRKDKPFYFVRFGHRALGAKLPKFRVRAEVNYENGQFAYKLPEQQNMKAAVTPTTKRPYVKQSDTLTAALNMLNKYATENDYEWEVKDGKAALVKSHRIG